MMNWDKLYNKLDDQQKKEINKGLKDGLHKEDIQILLDPNLNPKKIELLILAILHGVPYYYIFKLMKSTSELEVLDKLRLELEAINFEQYEMEKGYAAFKRKY